MCSTPLPSVDILLVSLYALVTVCRRDLKTQNILCDLASGRAKVADFGMSRVDPSKCRTNEERETLTEHSPMTAKGIGTLQYLPPEICTNQMECADLSEYNQTVDQFAFAVVMWEMMTHQTPWGHIQEDDEDGQPVDVQIMQAVAAGARLTVPEQASDGAPEGWCNLMHLCWAQDPQNRPEFKAAYQTLGEMVTGFDHFTTSAAEADQACNVSTQSLRPRASATIRMEPSPSLCIELDDQVDELELYRLLE